MKIKGLPGLSLSLGVFLFDWSISSHLAQSRWIVELGKGSSHYPLQQGTKLRKCKGVKCIVNMRLPVTRCESELHEGRSPCTLSACLKYVVFIVVFSRGKSQPHS